MDRKWTGGGQEAAATLYHGASDEGQSTLGFALSELQAVDVLQSNSVLIHLLANDKFNTPAVGERERKKPRSLQ